VIIDRQRRWPGRPISGHHNTASGPRDRHHTQLQRFPHLYPSRERRERLSDSDHVQSHGRNRSATAVFTVGRTLAILSVQNDHAALPAYGQKVWVGQDSITGAMLALPCFQGRPQPTRSRAVVSACT
jgi:hypothetical protein